MSPLELSRFKEYIRYAEFKRILDRVILLESSPQVLCILSLYPQEGKTFFSLSLAIGMSTLLKKKVLLIDTAFSFQRKGSIRLPGLVASTPMAVCASRVHKISSDVSGVDFRLAASDEYELDSILNQAKSQYDFVLIDTCAIRTSNRNNVDPVLVARRCDRSIAVLTSSSLNRDGANQLNHLGRLSAIRWAGTIFNSHAQGVLS